MADVKKGRPLENGKGENMKIRKETDYAIRILQYLDSRKGKLCTSLDISTATGMNHSLATELAEQLRWGGFIRTTQGKENSYELGKLIHTISAYDVYACIESVEERHSSFGSMRSIQGKIFEEMSNISIADWVLDSLEGHMNQTLPTGLRHTAQFLKAQAERLYSVNTENNETRMIPFHEIVLFKSTSQKDILDLHGKQGLLKIRGRISRVAGDASELFRSHMSVVVNITHIHDIDEDNGELKLTNGMTAPITKAKIPLLLRLMAEHTKAIG